MNKDYEALRNASIDQRAECEVAPNQTQSSERLYAPSKKRLWLGWMFLLGLSCGIFWLAASYMGYM